MSTIQEAAQSCIHTLLAKETIKRLPYEIKQKKVIFLDCVSDDEDSGRQSPKLHLRSKL